MSNPYVLKVCGGILAGWAMTVGLMMAFASDSRFTSVQWKFILQIPGGQVTTGFLFLALGTLMAYGIISNRKHLASYSAIAMGCVTTIFATTLGLAAATESTGGIMGLPTFGVIGLFYLVYQNLVRENT